MAQIQSHSTCYFHLITCVLGILRFAVIYSLAGRAYAHINWLGNVIDYAEIKCGKLVPTTRTHSHARHVQANLHQQTLRRVWACHSNKCNGCLFVFHPNHKFSQKQQYVQTLTSRSKSPSLMVFVQVRKAPPPWQDEFKNAFTSWVTNFLSLNFSIL